MTHQISAPVQIPLDRWTSAFLGAQSLTIQDYENWNLERLVLGQAFLCADIASDPTDSRAEKAASHLLEAVSILTPSCFLYEKHGQMWDCLLTRYLSSQPFDALAVVDEAWPAGGLLYYSEVLDCLTRIPSRLAHSSALLYEKHRQRGLDRVMQRHAQRQQAGNLKSEELQALLDADLRGWEQSDLRGTTSNIKQDAIKFMQDMEAAQKNGAKTLWTGIRKLDDSIQGIMGGEYVVLAGRPGSGKTSLACNNIQHQCEQGLGVVFCSLEMTKNQVMARLVQQMTGVSAKWLLTGDRRMHDVLHKVQRAVETIATWPLVIYDHSGLAETSTVPMLLQRAQKEVGDISLVVYDHLGEATKGAQDKQQETTAKSGILRDMAKDTGAVVMSLVQMNRDIEKGGKNAEGKLKRPPQMSDLRDAGEIEEQASLILFTHNQEQIVVAKSRYGSQDMVDCRFRQEWTRWS